jgi:hypothetical protein
MIDDRISSKCLAGAREVFKSWFCKVADLIMFIRFWEGTATSISTFAFLTVPLPFVGAVPKVV